MAGRQEHWDTVYTTKATDAVSWFQPEATRSLALIAAASPHPDRSVIDVGGGASTLIDGLLARGYRDLTVLDISAAALEAARARLGAAAQQVIWLVADVTQWQPDRTWDIWHDRAVFHFLTEAAQQDAYVAALTRATRPGSTVIIATFAPDGPEKCSGLPVQRYDADAVAKRLGPRFALVDQVREIHRTPWDSEQRFSYAVLNRLA